jgi:hypothetical protein
MGSRRTAAGPFSTQPSGPRPVGCFSAFAGSLRINLDMLVAPPASLREALRAGRALKNSQLIRPLPDAVTIICETVH